MASTLLLWFNETQYSEIVEIQTDSHIVAFRIKRMKEKWYVQLFI